MIQYVVMDLFHIISHLTLSEETKQFLLNLPVGFWTLMSGAVTACVALATLMVTQTMNKKTQAIQLKHQEQITAKQLSHQRELAYRQHFLDKRTDTLLDFQKALEECMEIFEYFYDVNAETEREEKLNIKYRVGPLGESEIENDPRVDDMIAMAYCALKQLSDIEEKTNALRKAANLFAIYLEKMEALEVRRMVRIIWGTQEHYISVLKSIKERPNVKDSNFLMFVSMAGSPNATDLFRSAESVRRIFAKYLYIDKLDV